MFATPRVHGGRSNVKVFVRTRPLLPAEYEEGARNIIHAFSADRLVVIEDGSDKSFKYEGVLEEDAGQDEVYRQAVAPLVTRVKEGCNATVLAYGQTGSGKTYTMGTNPCVSKENEGILQRALQDFLSVDENYSPSNSSTSHELRISMVEIYSETVYDLLASKSELKIKNEIGGGASIIGLVEEPVNTLEKGLALLEKGSHLRSVGTTAMNNGSSRSHALIFLTVKCGRREGCLKLVDLAGAEGVGRAQSSGLQFTEGVNINKGLLSLGKVLAALSNSSVYVPYRESLLTRVLKDSLGGGSYTTMIACVNPSCNNVHETVNTLRYAEQARNIKTRVQALSTIKKRGAKRRLEDISANAEAWKKQVFSTEKAEHNSTISTPGHKPSVRKLAPFLNMTVTTPCERASNLLPVTEEKHAFDIGKTLFPPSHIFPSLAKPIIEDDSPSGLSTVSAIEETKTSPSVDSPFMERLTNRLERTMMAQLENLQESIADTIITKLTQKNKGKQKRKEREIIRKSTCSTPTKRDSSLGTDDESSSHNILEETIAHALFRKSNVKNVLVEAVSSVLGQFIEAPSKASDKVDETETKQFFPKFIRDQKALKDVTNVSKLHETCYKKEHLGAKSKVFQTPSMHTNQEDVKRNLPITSTVMCESRMVRRSRRLSTRSLYNASITTHTPEINPHSEDTVCMNDRDSPSFVGDVSVMEANTTVFQANVDSSRQDPFSNDTTINFITQEVTMNENLNAFDQNKQKSELHKACRRRSTRLEALKATQKNSVILQGQSPVLNTKKRRSYNRGNVSLNSVSRKASSSVLNSTVPSQDYTVMARPRQQEKHNDSILAILNTGNLRELQQLPTVGPKTAMVIFNFWKLYGKFSMIEELERVPGLSKNFYSRFLAANLLTGLLQ